MSKQKIMPRDVAKEKEYHVEFFSRTPPVSVQLTCKVKAKVTASTKEEALKKAAILQQGVLIAYSDIMEEIQDLRVRIKDMALQAYKDKKMPVLLDNEAEIEEIFSPPTRPSSLDQPPNEGSRSFDFLNKLNK